MVNVQKFVSDCGESALAAMRDEQGAGEHIRGIKTDLLLRVVGHGRSW